MNIQEEIKIRGELLELLSEALRLIDFADDKMFGLYNIDEGLYPDYEDIRTRVINLMSNIMLDRLKS